MSTHEASNEYVSTNLFNIWLRNGVRMDTRKRTTYVYMFYEPKICSCEIAPTWNNLIWYKFYQNLFHRKTIPLNTILWCEMCSYKSAGDLRHLITPLLSSNVFLWNKFNFAVTCVFSPLSQNLVKFIDMITIAIL